jgi:hypothetical protein
VGYGHARAAILGRERDLDLGVLDTSHERRGSRELCRFTARPNAHAHIQAIAAYSLALAGRLNEARAHMTAIHKTIARYDIDGFLAAFQFGSEIEAKFREGARRIAVG